MAAWLHSEPSTIILNPLWYHTKGSLVSGYKFSPAEDCNSVCICNICIDLIDFCPQRGTPKVVRNLSPHGKILLPLNVAIASINGSKKVCKDEGQAAMPFTTKQSYIFKHQAA